MRKVLRNVGSWSLLITKGGTKLLRSSGSRWIAHKWGAMKHNISKYGAYTSHLATLSEDATVKPVDKSKLKGYYKRWVDAKYLLGCAVFCAHTLQLVIKDGFKQAGNITKVLSKVSTIVSFSRESTLAAEVLEAEKRLKTANATRWNSHLQSIRLVPRTPEETLNSLNATHLSIYDRRILEDIVEILTPFETATQCIQGDKVVTSSMVILCMCS